MTILVLDEGAEDYERLTERGNRETHCPREIWKTGKENREENRGKPEENRENRDRRTFLTFLRVFSARSEAQTGRWTSIFSPRRPEE